MRYAVTIDPITLPKSPEQHAGSDAYGVPASFEPLRKPASRSHNPENNQKRTDPFSFGSRYLEEGDDVFEFNAWDHVETDESYREFSELQYQKQREAPVSDFDKSRFNSNPSKWWNLFYANNRTNFFKNRKWLTQEFPVLSTLTTPSSPPSLILEVGAGAGNTAFPILAINQNPHLKLHACDFSAKAVDLIRLHEAYDTKYIQADVWDVAGTGEAVLPPGIEPGSVDVVLMIFIFSALAPAQWAQAVRNIWRVLKPGGQVLFRDYGRGDLAQVRFKKGRWMEENFYVRGDGTRVYFFEKEELERIWAGGDVARPEEKESRRQGTEDIRQNAVEVGVGDIVTQTETLTLESRKEETETEIHIAPELTKIPTLDPTPQRNQDEDTDSTELPLPVFETVHFGVDRRMLVNRQRKLKMYRCWMQAVFRKPGSSSNDSSTANSSSN